MVNVVNSKGQVGFNQRIQLDWLELTAANVAARKSRSEIHAILDNYLADKLSIGGQSQYSNRRKAITILLKIWASTPEALIPLRDEGLKYLRNSPQSHHFPIHWGMTMAVYPFFGLVAKTVGRLLRLQGTLTPAQVLRRVKAQLGERETVTRATQRVLRCFVDWQVLQDTGERGVYQAASVQSIEDQSLIVWLIEAALVASAVESGSVKEITQTPALFPFSVEQPNLRQLETNQRLELFRQGLDQDVIVLCAAGR